LTVKGIRRFRIEGTLSCNEVGKSSLVEGFGLDKRPATATC